MDNRWLVYKDGDRVYVECEIVGSSQDVMLAPLHIVGGNVSARKRNFKYCGVYGQAVRLNDFIEKEVLE